MPVTKILLTYGFMTVVFFIIDLLWLGIFAKGLYQKYLGHLLGEVNWTAAFIFYLIFISGILIFAVLPGIEKSSFLHAVTYGVLFGFFTYATYDLTNLATLKDWPVTIVYIDIVWGMVLSGSVATLGFLFARWLMQGS